MVTAGLAWACGSTEPSVPTSQPEPSINELPASTLNPSNTTFTDLLSPSPTATAAASPSPIPTPKAPFIPTSTPVPSPTPVTAIIRPLVPSATPGPTGLQYRLEAAIIPTGLGSVSVFPTSEDSLYKPGTDVLITAECNMEFLAWKGNVPIDASATSTTITVTMDRHRDLTAVCSGPNATPPPTATPMPMPTQTPTPHPTDTPMPMPTPTLTPSPTPPPTPIPTPTPVPTRIVLSPQDASPGSNATLTGTGFIPATHVGITYFMSLQGFDALVVDVTTVITDADGSFQATIEVPQSLFQGPRNSFTAFDGGAKVATVDHIIVVATPTPTPRATAVPIPAFLVNRIPGHVTDD